MHSTTQCHALVLGMTGTTYIRQQQKYIGREKYEINKNKNKNRKQKQNKKTNKTKIKIKTKNETNKTKGKSIVQQFVECGVLRILFVYFSSYGGWGKMKVKLTTLPRGFIHVVCRFHSIAFAIQR